MSGAPALLRLPRTGSTNAWAKAHAAAFDRVGAVYTTDQTAGRGRLGSAWADAAGQALFYTAVLPVPPARLMALPLVASLLVSDVLYGRYGLRAQIKWPNDLLLGGKKLVGILCEAAPAGRVVCGIGVNLSQTQAFFDRCGLPHATSLALQGAAVTPDAADLLAADLTRAFAASLPALLAGGFAPWQAAYRAACINLDRQVCWDGGQGLARDIDAEGRLVVDGADGEQRLFTGEVRVRGIYGQL